MRFHPRRSFRLPGRFLLALNVPAHLLLPLTQRLDRFGAISVNLDSLYRFPRDIPRGTTRLNRLSTLSFSPILQCTLSPLINGTTTQ